MTKERLNKYLAGAGIASRRKADELIEQGKVKVNGKIITDLGVQVDPEKDKVEYQSKILQPAAPLLFMFNKPVGVTSTMADQHAEKTIADYFKNIGRVYPVGRLDKESCGLMLVTNNGELANKLMHPRYEHEKEYEVIISRHAGQRGIRHSGELLGRLQNRMNKSIRSWTHPSPKGYGGLTQSQDDEEDKERNDLIERFSQRFISDGYKTQPMLVKTIKKINPPHQSSLPAKLRLASPNPSSNLGEERRDYCYWLISLVLKEGRKRQIRRVAELLGYRVVQLKRVRMGKLKIGNLPIGKFRPINPAEVI